MNWIRTYGTVPAGTLEQVLLELPLQDNDVPLLQPLHVLLPPAAAAVRDDEGLGEAQCRHAQTPAQHEHIVVAALGQRAGTPADQCHHDDKALKQGCGSGPLSAGSGSSKSEF